MGANDSYKRWHKPVKNTFKENGALGKGQTYQGYYIPKNKEKYAGDPNLIIFRSAWEFSFCMWADYSDSVIKWSSEPFKIPYFDKVSKLEECKKLGLNPNNPHNWVRKNYNTDFWVQINKGDDVVEKWLIEIKPKRQLYRPKSIPKESKIAEIRKYNNALKQYMINEAKFEAASAFATRGGMKFMIFHDDVLDRLGIVYDKKKRGSKLSRFDIKRKENKIHYKTL
jgi:hypothetical protein